MKIHSFSSAHNYTYIWTNFDLTCGKITMASRSGAGSFITTSTSKLHLVQDLGKFTEYI